MPDRIIRDRARSSPSLQLLSDAGERAWWRLTVAVDDYGRFDAEPEVLLSRLFERKPKGWTVAKISAALEEWTAGDDPLVHLYQVPGDPRIYGHVVHFRAHQRSRDSKPKFPEPPCKNCPPNATSPQLAATCRTSRLARAGVREAGVERREPRGESRESGIGGPGGNLPQDAHTDTSQPPATDEPEALRALWNAACALSRKKFPDLKCMVPCRDLTGSRRKKALERLGEAELGWHEKAIAKLAASAFANGKETVDGKTGKSRRWRVSFDWYIANDTNCVKAYEGRYDD